MRGVDVQRQAGKVLNRAQGAGWLRGVVCSVVCDGVVRVPGENRDANDTVAGQWRRRRIVRNWRLRKERVEDDDDRVTIDKGVKNGVEIESWMEKWCLIEG